VADGPTKAVDYVMFRRKRINYDKKPNSKGYYGLNLPGNNVKFNFDDVSVYLAMPQSLQTSYNPGYRTQDLGVGGMVAAGVLDIDPKKTEVGDIVDTLQKAARAALPQFANAAVADIANSASGALGLAGSIDANALQQLTKGKIFNPYTEQLFSNMTFRSHQFSFKLFARDPDEAEEINKIVRYFKQGATPILNRDPNKFMEVPDKFDIKFVRMDPTMKTFRNSNEMHFKMFSSVCNGISVNYTPDGQYNAFKETAMGTTGPLQVPAIALTLSFLETRFIGQEDITRGY
tara:strand:+ start:2074 stop:2940 length:867 start_codon:yes stop_codon:yes gene_type:complete